MIFRHLHIDGFGIWRDLTLEELDPGLNVFLAPNEGGKTTLMTFIRAVLYGFRKRGHPERYSPLRGGKHGGFLEVDADGKLYRIGRTSDKSSQGALQISDANGKPLPETTLARLLSGTTRELYESVFAFGLAELQKIDTMRTEEIAAHIYSAGMAAAGSDPIGFRDRLDVERGKLFKPRGKHQEVTQLMTRIQQLRHDLEPLQQLPEEHGNLLEQDAHLRQRLEELDEELDKQQRRLDAARRARSAWGDYEELLAAELSLEALGVPLEKAGAAEAVELLGSEQSAVLAEAGRVRGLLATAPRLRELRAAADKHRAEADSANAVLQSHLKDLGTGWDVERILKTEASLEQREAARSFGGNIREHATEIESIAGRAAEAHDAYESIVSRSATISKEVVMLTWVVAAVLTLLSVSVPASVRLLVVPGVAGLGFVAGVVATWLRIRGQRQLDDERLASAEREETLWSQHVQAEGQLKEKQKDWGGWLTKQSLDKNLIVDGALDLLDRVREAQEVARQQEAAAESGEKAQNELSVAGGRINALLVDLGREPVQLGEHLLEAVEPLLGHLETLQADLDSAEDHQLRLRKEMQQYAQAHAALRAGAGEERPEALRSRLEGLDPDQIHRLVDEAEGAAAAVRAQRDGINEQLGGVAERMSHVEQDVELGELLLEREQARASLMQAVTTWTAYTAAAALFDRAKKIYEEERQPDVLRLASEYFGAMTRGAYDRVMAPLGEIDLAVQEAKSGKRKGPSALSRGTKEQLYLSMRLALAAVYADESVALPLVADDILVNFDDGRAEATAGLLGTYAAQGNQVLAFTCHQRVAEVFERQAPNARVIELPSPR